VGHRTFLLQQRRSSDRSKDMNRIAANSLLGEVINPVELSLNKVLIKCQMISKAESGS
jgi:hypothetical protein